MNLGIDTTSLFNNMKNGIDTVKNTLSGNKKTPGESFFNFADKMPSFDELKHSGSNFADNFSERAGNTAKSCFEIYKKEALNPERQQRAEIVRNAANAYKSRIDALETGSCNPRDILILRGMVKNFENEIYSNNRQISSGSSLLSALIGMVEPKINKG